MIGFSGDTGPTDRFWQLLAAQDNTAARVATLEGELRDRQQQ